MGETSICLDNLSKDLAEFDGYKCLCDVECTTGTGNFEKIANKNFVNV